MTSPPCVATIRSLTCYPWPNTAHHCHPIGQDSSGPLKHRELRSPPILWILADQLANVQHTPQSPPDVSRLHHTLPSLHPPSSPSGLAWSKFSCPHVCVSVNNPSLVMFKYCLSFLISILSFLDPLCHTITSLMSPHSFVICFSRKGEEQTVCLSASRYLAPPLLALKPQFGA